MNQSGLGFVSESDEISPYVYIVQMLTKHFHYETRPGLLWNPSSGHRVWTWMALDTPLYGSTSFSQLQYRQNRLLSKQGNLYFARPLKTLLSHVGKHLSVGPAGLAGLNSSSLLLCPVKVTQSFFFPPLTSYGATCVGFMTSSGNGTQQRERWL